MMIIIINTFINTDNIVQKDLALFGLRVTLGSIFITHACDKLGWYNLSVFWETDNLLIHTQNSLGTFSGIIHEIFPMLTHNQSHQLASFSALAELIAGFAIFLGIFSRLAAFYLCSMMCFAIYYHFPNGFYGSENGYEWAMLCLGGSQAILFMGEGRFSIYNLYLVTTTEQMKAL